MGSLALPRQLVDADWIFHVDTDELLHPAGTPSYSLQELVISQPPDIDTIVFPNYVRGRYHVWRLYGVFDRFVGACE